LAHFLLKTEPSDYSFDDMMHEGETVWDGVTNNLALKNIRLMKAGDDCLIYHSGDDKTIVGIGIVIRHGYPDPKKGDAELTVVDIKASKRLKRPVPLSSLKGIKDLARFDLIRLPRLSVMPVPDNVWKVLMKISEEK
jgi:predicted RNA-binding protein with PUA-like domain